MLLKPTLPALPPSIWLEIARWALPDLPKLQLLSKQIRRSLNNPALWADYAVDAVGLEESAAWAVERGCADFSILQRLLEIGAADGDLLANLAGEGKVELLDRILRLRNVTGEMAVTAAASRGNVKVLNLLLSRGCPTNEVALWSAANTGNMAVVEILLDHGVCIGPECVETACIAADVAMLKLFHSKGAAFPPTAVYCACRSQNPEIVNLVVNLGAPLIGDDCVIEACRTNNIPILKMLLDRGAPLPARTSGDPLEIAIAKHADKCASMVQLLLGMGLPVTESAVQCAIDRHSDTNLSLLVNSIPRDLPWIPAIYEKIKDDPNAFPMSVLAIQQWVR